jgi:hypothetical protein
VFFIDGDRAWTPIAIPDELLAMMDDVAAAKFLTGSTTTRVIR